MANIVSTGRPLQRLRCCSFPSLLSESVRPRIGMKFLPVEFHFCHTVDVIDIDWHDHFGNIWQSQHITTCFTWTFLSQGPTQSVTTLWTIGPHNVRRVQGSFRSHLDPVFFPCQLLNSTAGSTSCNVALTKAIYSKFRMSSRTFSDLLYLPGPGVILWGKIRKHSRDSSTVCSRLDERIW